MDCTLVRDDGSRWTVTDLRLRDGRPRVWAHRSTGRATRNAREHWETLDGIPLKTTDRLTWRDRADRPVFELRGRLDPAAADVEAAEARATGSGASGLSLSGGAPRTEGEVRDAVDDGFFRDSFLSAEEGG